jgi:hypothetical protein
MVRLLLKCVSSGVQHRHLRGPNLIPDAAVAAAAGFHAGPAHECAGSQPARIHTSTTKDMEPDFQSTQSEGRLDGSAAGMHRFLSELVALAAQDDSGHSAPMLELQFGEVLAKTSMCKRDLVDCVMIVLVLPKCEPAQLGPPSLFPDDAFAAELLWHAEEGRHIIVRHLPVASFKDETAVLDTIMASADQVRAWLAADQQRHLRTVSDSGHSHPRRPKKR